MIAWVEAYRAGLFNRTHWLRNLVAGVIVGVVALPLAMAFAIASGAKPEQGIYTAIVAGIVVSIAGGSRFQIAGPTGAFIVILAAVTAEHGIEACRSRRSWRASCCCCSVSRAWELRSSSSRPR